MTIIGTGVSVSNDPLSLLDLVIRFCERTGLNVPETVMGNTDRQIVQIRALVEEEGKDLSRRGQWEALTYEATHTTTAAEDQGAIGDIATNNFRAIKNDTIWDRTDRLPVYGPLNEREWQYRKAISSVGPRYNYRLRGGRLLVNPTPAADHTWAFEYFTKNWILSADGDGREYFLVDEDVTAIPGELVLQGVRWRWKKEKGLEYAEDFRTYELMVSDAIGQDGGNRVLSMVGTVHEMRPGILVPDYNWDLS